MSDIILDACLNFESYPSKTVGGDRFWKKCLTDRQTDRRTDDGHRVMGKALADIVSWANKTFWLVESYAKLCDVHDWILPVECQTCEPIVQKNKIVEWQWPSFLKVKKLTI